MSLDTVVEDIREKARARADEIREEGDRRAEEIVDEARADAEQTRREREEQIEDRIERERDQTLSSANLSAKQERLKARRDALEEVRERVEQRLADLEGERRAELTRTLLDAAAPEFEDDADVSVYGRAADRALLEELLTDYDGFAVAGERDCLGGVFVQSEGSRVRVNNTFDSVLEDVWENNLREISARLFDDE